MRPRAGDVVDVYLAHRLDGEMRSEQRAQPFLIEVRMHDADFVAVKRRVDVRFTRVTHAIASIANGSERRKEQTARLERVRDCGQLLPDRSGRPMEQRMGREPCCARLLRR